MRCRWAGSINEPHHPGSDAERSNEREQIPVFIAIDNARFSKDALRAVLAMVGLLVGVGIGLAAGNLLQHDTSCSTFAGLACLAGLVALVVGACRDWAIGRGFALRVATAFALAGYVCLLVVFDENGPLISATWSEYHMLVAIAFLVPFVLGGVFFPTRGSWIQGAGCWAVLSGAVTALVYNGNHVYSAIGFVLTRRE